MKKLLFVLVMFLLVSCAPPTVNVTVNNNVDVKQNQSAQQDQAVQQQADPYNQTAPRVDSNTLEISPELDILSNDAAKYYPKGSAEYEVLYSLLQTPVPDWYRTQYIRESVEYAKSAVKQRTQPTMAPGAYQGVLTQTAKDLYASATRSAATNAANIAYP